MRMTPLYLMLNVKKSSNAKEPRAMVTQPLFKSPCPDHPACLQDISLRLVLRNIKRGNTWARRVSFHLLVHDVMEFIFKIWLTVSINYDFCNRCWSSNPFYNSWELNMLFVPIQLLIFTIHGKNSVLVFRVK